MLLIEHLFFLHEICVRRRSRAIKDLSNLLQAPTLRLWKEEILDSEENDQQTAKDYVVLPAQVSHADRIDEGLDDQRNIDGDQFAADTLRSQTR